MAVQSRQKQKLLTMKKLFEAKTDENHSFTGAKLIEILGEIGIKAERKTIYDDIKTLCDSGMDIVTVKDGHSNAYYLGERTFQQEELFVLADAIASSRFLTRPMCSAGTMWKTPANRVPAPASMFSRGISGSWSMTRSV